MSREKKSTALDQLNVLASVVALPVSLYMMSSDIVDKIDLKEFVVPGLSILSAGAAGLASLYIARLLKRFSKDPRVFISYSRDNRDAALALKSELERFGARVWFDETTLRAGDNVDSAIAAAIESSNKMVAIISKTPGKYASYELGLADQRKVPIIAIGSEGVSESLSKLDPSRITLLDKQASTSDLAKIIVGQG